MTDIFNHGERPSFIERLAVLAGKTTYTVPMGGRSSQVKKVPDAHAIAMALSFARNGKEDIGPDVAYDLATSSIRHRATIVRAVASAIGKDRHCRPVRRNRPWIHMACNVAYCEIMGYSLHACPHSVTQNDWALLVEASKRVMLTMAESAVYRAERAFYSKAIDTA